MNSNMICGYTVSYLVSHMDNHNVDVYAAMINDNPRIYFYQKGDERYIDHLTPCSDFVYKLNRNHTWQIIHSKVTL